MSKVIVSAKEKFNALQNARHIFSLKEDGTKFRLVELINSEEDTKAIAVSEEGEIFGIFTDSRSAKSGLQDVLSAFGDAQPLIAAHIKTTAKGQSVYYFEVE